MIVEALSPSTRPWDLGQKFEYYRALSPFREFIVIEQSVMRASQWSRQAEGSWLLRDITGPEATIELQSIGCKLRLADLYERVDLAPS